MTLTNPIVRRLFGALGALLIGVTVAVAAPNPSPASATAQTCIAAPSGTLCTIVYGNRGRVDAVGTSRMKVNPLSGQLFGICDYNAWFFVIHKNGRVESLGTEGRYGCGIGRVWLTKQVNRTFPRGTLVCAKFYENRWNTFVSEKCVGLS